jgi:hypothetical protein
MRSQKRRREAGSPALIVKRQDRIARCAVSIPRTGRVHRPKRERFDSALGYINTIAAQFSQDYVTNLAERTQGIKGMEQVQVTVAQRPWYNPDFNGRWFFVPGAISAVFELVPSTKTWSGAPWPLRRLTIPPPH